jgi:hypothetical protein
MNEYSGFKVFQCPKCNGTDISYDLKGKFSCLNPNCKYSTIKPKVIDGEILLKPHLELEKREKEKMKIEQYFELKDQKLKNVDTSPHSIP